MVRHRCGLLLSPILPVLLALCTWPASAQQAAPSPQTLANAGGRTKIILTELNAPAGDPVAEKLASTITSSLEVMMKLSGTLAVSRADFLAPSVAFSRARGYYTEVNANGAVYGSVAPTSNGGYRISLGLWNGSKPSAPPELFHRTISNLLTSFTMADRLALAVTSTIVGHTLHEGTLQVENTKLLAKYAVYADGHLLARNRASLAVLAGKREIVIAKPGGPLGDVPVEVFHVTIRGGQTTTVKLSAKKIAAGTSGKKLALALPAKPALPQQTTTKKPAPAAAKPPQASPASQAKKAPPAVTRIAQHGKSAVVRVATAGRLYVDGKADGTVLPGQSRLVTGLATGYHRFVVTYSDGQQNSGVALFTAANPLVNFDFHHRKMTYGKARLFHAASLSFGKQHYKLGSPGRDSAALNALLALPTVTPGIQSEIVHAQTLVKSWRPQRLFHLLWLGTFWAGIGTSLLSGLSSTAPSTGANLTEIGVTFTSILFLIINAEHRGVTRGGISSDLQSIAGSFNSQIASGGDVGLLVAGAKSAGELFVDGSAKGRVTPGHSLTVYGLSLGKHIVTVHYPNGHLESDRVVLSKGSRSPSIYFGYAAKG